MVASSEQPRPVDLANLAIPMGQPNSIDRVSFRAVSGLWYTLRTFPRTCATKIIAPLHLEVDAESLSSDPDMSAFFVVNTMKNWLLERRKFSEYTGGSLAKVKNEVINQGDRLTVGIDRTRPLNLAVVSFTPSLEEQEKTGKTHDTQVFFGFSPR